MAEKIENALNEARILILVVQVVLGFQYQAMFQPGFEKLSHSSQYFKLGGLGLMLFALTLLIAPVAHHRMIERGNLSTTLLRFITAMTVTALLPFAFGLGADFYVVSTKLYGQGAGVLLGSISIGIALLFWYGIEGMMTQHTHRRQDENTPHKIETTPLKEKIRCVLTEARVVLPGTQALLGFQFAAVLTEAFDKLPATSKSLHFVGLVMTAFSTFCLIAPPAFHRIVEKGENTERLHTFASKMILAAMAFLALGIACDVFVVVLKVSANTTAALIAACLTLCLCFGFWFGYMLYRRASEARTLHPLFTSPVPPAQ